VVTGALCRRGQSFPKLIVAVSAYADGKGPCPWELTEAFLCKEYHILPAEGSLERQDMTTLARYEALVNIYRVCMDHNRGGWKALSGTDKQMLMEIADLELKRADH